MKKYISIILSGLLVASCVDTVLLPDDKTVDEDFWKSKSDVSLMVNGAYRALASTDAISRLIVWGDFRSDELLYVPSIATSYSIRQALEEIEEVNVQTDNNFSDWSSIYSVINYCNIVLEKAGGVVAVDPSYTQGDYETDRSQMLALRSLCYFYLVRTFRDVPYTTTAYMNSSQDMTMSQLAPADLLEKCISDLEEASKNSLSPQLSGWRRVGWINSDAINSILADIYLWRASITHSEEDYNACVSYCDKVIDSKKQLHVAGVNELETKEYPLEDGYDAFKELYIDQNAEESIFELQFDGTSAGSNTGVCQMFYKFKDNNSNIGYVKASSIFGTVGASNAFATNKDYRFWNNIFLANKSDETFDIRKMVANTHTNYNLSSPPASGYVRAARAYSNYKQNYIIYRLSDILLMKAEALTQIAADKDDIRLRQAFNLVQFVNARSLYQGSLNDSLKWNTYNDKEKMETLVLQERLRELCFEGKRWYDLMRYNFRKVEGIDYTTILAEQSKAGKNFVLNSQDMLNLVVRKYSSGGSARAAKMRTEPYLYMPIPRRDIEMCKEFLQQNPVYSDGKSYEKNN